jgi:hypothetical protein
MEPTFTRLPPEMHRAVEKVAAQEDRPVSAMLRVLIKEGLLARNAYPAVGDARRTARAVRA